MSCLLKECIDFPCRLREECAFYKEEVKEILVNATKGFDLKIEVEVNKNEN